MPKAPSASIVTVRRSASPTARPFGCGSRVCRSRSAARRDEVGEPARGRGNGRLEGKRLVARGVGFDGFASIAYTTVTSNEGISSRPSRMGYTR